jgi:hypothetical protein
MNRLEQYIRNHKNRLEEEPADGHFERLQHKMNRKPGRIAVWQWSVSIAASVAIVLLTGMCWKYTGKPDVRMAICENSLDMKFCYLDKMNAVAVRIETLTQNLDQWNRQQVMTDVQNIIDAAGSGFESEIPEELPDSEAKSILSNYYRQHLEGLEMIAKEL